MSREETKQHFAEICETIWGKIESQQQVDAENAESMRQIVTSFAMIAWNKCLEHTSFAETQKALRKLAAVGYENSPCALIPLMDTAELKWHDFRNDLEPIAKAEVKMVDGAPKAIAYLEGECSDGDSVTGELEEIIGKVAAESNARLSVPFGATDDTDDEDDRDGDMFEQDFPITREELDAKYQFMRETPQEDKKKMLAAVLKMHPYLAPLCKDTLAAPPVSDVILAVFSTFIKDSHLFGLGDVHFRKGLKLAQELVSDFIDDKEQFPAVVEDFGEPNLFVFLAETVDGFKLPQKVFKKTLSTLLAWGFMVESSRIAEHPDRYDSKFLDDEQEEEYDFDEKNLHALQLHVKLLGYRCSADVLVREDCTFEDLHDFLNPLFNREDDHLYRFECEDGCTAVRDEEDIDDDEVLSNECYVGHHLSPGSGAYYIFDYGDEWEHDITVKKVTVLDPKVNYPKVLKITGKIPEQYPDYDEEEEDEE